MAKTKTVQRLTGRDYPFRCHQWFDFWRATPRRAQKYEHCDVSQQRSDHCDCVHRSGCRGRLYRLSAFKYIGVIFQTAKFGCVGAANFRVDIGILNL